MRNFVITLTLILSALVLIGCGTTKYVPQVVTQVSHDTLYLNKVQYDSIFINHELIKDYRRGNPSSLRSAGTDACQSKNSQPSTSTDTIYIRDVSVQYKYKLLRDTTFIHQVDSIPVIKEIEVTREVRGTCAEHSRSIPWWSKALSWVGGIVILFFIIWLAAKLIFKL